LIKLRRENLSDVVFVSVGAKREGEKPLSRLIGKPWICRTGRRPQMISKN